MYLAYLKGWVLIHNLDYNDANFINDFKFFFNTLIVMKIVLRLTAILPGSLYTSPSNNQNSEQQVSRKIRIVYSGN